MRRSLALAVFAAALSLAPATTLALDSGFAPKLLDAELEAPAEFSIPLRLDVLHASEGGLTPCIVSVIPGLGQWFNGQFWKGVVIFAAVVGLGSAGQGMGGGLGWVLRTASGVLWIAAFVDAWRGGDFIPPTAGSGGDAVPVRVIVPGDARPFVG